MKMLSFLKNLGLLFLYWLGFQIAVSLLQFPLLAPTIATLPELSATASFILVSLGTLAAVALTWLMWRKIHQGGLIEIEETPLTKSLWIPFVIYLVFIVVQMIFPTVSPNQENVQKMMTSWLGLSFFATVIVAPILEELFFRGLLAKLFFSKLSGHSSLVYLLTSGFLFSMAHTSATLYQFLIYLMMGVIFGLFYLTKKDIRYAIAMHAINNLLAFLLLLL
ncbi:CPBP family intramembrane glutamic endopeptidase [Streptococcus saliviloxodontae]|uniref:Membrane protease YdiL (CAAX protease family) n=1 Tax=Streptococcus saliviloxodontae TaxID=1349416 RepID=A0ABS2PM43_9STRE|nr:type II CAAX endopeptidase family protein [Streptococcus saliviloxodontae]MBM7636446.1 membrane protease YdiL (CAAX protease family) [Streptococcus saliviloxodontae]